MRKIKHKDKRLPSARVDKDSHYSDISPTMAGARMSNSLKRKKRLYENKLSINKKNEELKDISYRIHKSQRQYSMNSMIKNHNITNQNVNSFDFKQRGNNWFNEQNKDKLVNIKNVKNNMIYRRNGNTPNYKLFNENQLAHKKSIKIKKHERQMPSSFIHGMDGYSSNRSDNRNTLTKHRPVSASNSKRNPSNRPRNEEDIISKTSSSNNLIKQSTQRKPASARPKNRDGSKPEKSLFGAANNVSSLKQEKLFSKNNKMFNLNNNMMVGKAFGKAITFRESKSNKKSDKIITLGVPQYFN